MNVHATDYQTSIPAEFETCFAAQQTAYSARRNPDYATRKADLRQLLRLIKENADALVAAVNADYGCRASFETRVTEILQVQEGALDAIKHLRGWMRPQRRALDPTMYPLAKAWTFPQPVGVVGIVVPWNFPIALAFQPLIAAFSAGCPAMVKMSENSEHLAQALIEIAPRYFSADKLAFFSDGGGRGPSFTKLPFDHLFFTGSPATGRAVMANAAPNLTPVTLELGGKSPAIVAPDYPMKAAASRIMWAKMLNAGQICTNVDYLFLPEGKVEEFIAEATQVVSKRYPDLGNGDFTAIIDPRAYERLQATRADAEQKGARLVNLAGGQQGDPARRIMPPEAVIGATDAMMVMQREIFGPLLPILTYRDHEEVIDYIGARPRPLAFYLYSNDRALQRRYLDNTISGGVGINESVIQAGLHALPFGGSGNSGMGHYHGREGFLTFSKQRPVFQQGPIRALDMMMPPYAGLPTRMANILLRWKS